MSSDDEDWNEVEVEADDYENCWRNDADYDFVDSDAEDPLDEEKSDSSPLPDEINSESEEADGSYHEVEDSDRERVNKAPSSSHRKRGAEQTQELRAEKRAKTSTTLASQDPNPNPKRKPRKAKNWGKKFLSS